MQLRAILAACASGAGLIGGPVSAEAFAPVSSVVEAFKKELRDAQLRGTDVGCRLAVDRVDFEFELYADDSASGGAGGATSLFGLSLGASAETAETEGRRSTVAMSMIPSSDEEGLYDVSGEAAGLSAVLIDLKKQIALSAGSDPPFALDGATVSLRFTVERKAGGKLELAVANAAAASKWGRSHLVKLHLKSAAEGGC
jgi:hypothetical protein